MSSCSDCRLGVDHCHGTLIVHRERTVECTDTDCELGDLMRHAFLLDCTALLGGCCATEDRTDARFGEAQLAAIAS
jgi:hypothetical protein